MTTLVISHLLHDMAAGLARLGERFRLFIEGVEEARAKARLFDTLMQLSDSELARRGLKRADIARTVFIGPDRA